MFVAVDYRNGKLGIRDTDDGALDYYTPKEIRHFLMDLNIQISGVVVDDRKNPIYTVYGLSINLYRENCLNLGNFVCAFLYPSDPTVITRNEVAKNATVIIYSVKNRSFEEPMGMQISSYYAEDLVYHTGILRMDMGVPEWTLMPDQMSMVRTWLQVMLNDGGIKYER